MSMLSFTSHPLKNGRDMLEKNFQQLVSRSTKVLALALGVPLLVLLGLVFFMMRSAAMVDHTDEVVLKALQAENLLITMQNGVRGYRAGRDPTYLEPYHEAIPQVRPRFEDLMKLVADNPEQQAKVMEVHKLADEWMSVVADYLEQIQQTGWEVDQATLQKARRLMDESRRGLDAFMDVEKGLREERAEQLHTLVVVLFSMFGLATLVGVPTLISFLQREMKAANLAYRESLSAVEKRAVELHVTLSSIGDAVVVTDMEGRVDFLNPVAEELVGWSAAEAQGRPLTEVFVIFNENTGELTENPVARVLREKRVVGLANHTVVRSRQGVEVPIEDSAAPIQNDNGDVLGVVLVFRDVSLKKYAEKRARFLYELGEATRPLVDVATIMEVATRRLGEYLQVSRCAYAEVDPETDRFVILNDYTDGCATTKGEYYLSMFGPRAVAEMHGNRTLVVRDVDAELVSKEGAAMFNQIGIKAVICCPLVKEGELRAMMAVHQLQARDWSPEEINLVEEVVERCWSTIERARVEMESNERAERFRLLSEVAALQVWTAQPNGDLDFISQNCLEYFGVSSKEPLLGQGWAAYVHLDDVGDADQKWQTALETGQGYETQFRLRQADGEYRWFIVRAEPLRHTNGKIYRWFGTNTDIHELKSAQTQAERANQAKDSFIAALSHELRTPLNPVLMAMAELQSDERLPADVHELVDMIKRNVALEARLIDDLLDITSIAQGKLQLHREPCDAHALIRLAMDIVRKDAVAKNISLTSECLATAFQLDADPTRFQQVIWNLLRNAVKFTPTGGYVTVKTTDRENHQLRIEVTDTGMGIEPHLLEKIFSPFEQGGLVGNHRFGGVGLGLAIARAITEAHGGTIRATSEGIGKGADFILEIPARRGV